MSGSTWGVRVNETGIFSTGTAAEWWAKALAPWEASGRAVCLGLCPQGGVWFLPAGGKEDAEWMRDHITGHGVHAAFVKVMTEARARRQAEQRARS